jgi:acetyltransferase-like isoleucine patch superfamily enzyme
VSDNLFFDRKDLKECGTNVIIGKTVRIRYPERVTIDDNVIIDDFVYISTELHLGQFVHISAGCKMIGGPNSVISIDRFSTCAPNVVLSAGSDDYVGGIASPMVAMEFKGDCEIGHITVGQHCIIGANSTVLPNVTFFDGAAVGAQSLVKSDLAAWSLYAGVPARLLRAREEGRIRLLEKRFWETRQNV